MTAKIIPFPKRRPPRQPSDKTDAALIIGAISLFIVIALALR